MAITPAPSQGTGSAATDFVSRRRHVRTRHKRVQRAAGAVSLRTSRAIIGASAVVSTFAGLAILPYALEESWFTWVPIGSTVPQTEFQPHPAFVASVMLLALGITAAVVLLVTWRAGGGASRAPMAFSVANFAVGAGLFLYGLFEYSFFIACGDPGGCSEYFAPYWPLMGPGAASACLGGIGLVYGFMEMRGRDSARSP